MTNPGVQPYDPNLQPYAAEAIPKAPAGTKTNTPWIWLAVLLPLVQLVPLFFIDWGSMFSSMFDVSSPTSSTRASLALMTSPAYLLTSLGSWVIYGLCALFAYLDFKQLRDAGVPRPFHFAWVFLGWVVGSASLVYVIGRSVVVKRRTGAGTAPMWVAIGVTVISLGVGVYIMVVIFSTMMTSIMNYNYGS
jgi:hypothetical protein